MRNFRTTHPPSTVNALVMMENNGTNDGLDAGTPFLGGRGANHTA